MDDWEQSQLDSLFAKLSALKQSQRFFEPLPWETAGVEQPNEEDGGHVTLANIKECLENHEYQTVDEFFEDLHTIIRNVQYLLALEEGHFEKDQDGNRLGKDKVDLGRYSLAEEELIYDTADFQEIVAQYEEDFYEKYEAYRGVGGLNLGAAMDGAAEAVGTQLGLWTWTAQRRR